MAKDKSEAKSKFSWSEFFLETLPWKFIDVLQTVLIVDKLLGLELLGRELTWLQVFIPFWCSLLTVAVFDMLGCSEEEK